MTIEELLFAVEKTIQEKALSSSEQREWNSPKGKRRVIGDTLVHGERRLLIATDETMGRGWGHVLLLPKDLEREIKFDEANWASQLQREAEAARKPTPVRDHKLDSFTSSMTPMQRAKAEAALKRPMRHNGEEKSRKRIIEGYVDEGATIAISPKGERRIQKPNGVFLDEKQMGKTAMDYAHHLSSITKKD